MLNLVEDFLQYLRHERGQAEHTQKTYAALLNKFTTWAAKQNLTDWKSVELKHLMAFLQYERARNLMPVGRASSRRTRRDQTKRRRLVRSLAPPKFTATVEQRECLSRNRRATGVLSLCRDGKAFAGERRGKSVAAAALAAAAQGADERRN